MIFRDNDSKYYEEIKCFFIAQQKQDLFCRIILFLYPLNYSTDFIFSFMRRLFCTTQFLIFLFSNRCYIIVRNLVTFIDFYIHFFQLNFNWYLPTYGEHLLLKKIALFMTDR